jgi:ADP-heptose:LPS heptosyltransferase
LGDAILAGTCFEALRDAFPKAWITALIQQPANKLYQRSGWVNEVLAYHRGSVDRKFFLSRLWKNYKMVRALRKRRFDLAIDFSASHRSAQFVELSRAGFKVGLGLPNIRRSYDLVAKADDELQVPATELDRRILNLLGLEPKPHDREDGYWQVPPDAIQYADTFWKANKFSAEDLVLAVNPFASCESKEWHAEKWARVLSELLAKGMKVFFTCAPLERKGLGKIEESIGRAIPVYSGGDVVPLMGLYKKSVAVLSADSGPRHLAAAVGTPTLTVWGPESVARWHPYSSQRHPVVLKEVPCRPCGLSKCVVKKHECMVALQPKDVLAALKQMLKGLVKT